MKIRCLRAVLCSLVAFAGCRTQPAPGSTARPGSKVGASNTSSYTLFETGQVRPLAMSPDGSLLFATNTPANRLEIFQASGGSLTRIGSVGVGLEPVAVAARSQTEVWVVNHLSDSISIVEASDPSAARVVRTLLVGDEPRDIVFAGPGRNRAFITTAHRGQNSPADPQLTTPGVGRADVWVFDANSLGDTLGGTPLNILTLFCDTPRALAVSPDGGTVYAAAFHSGDRTTTVSRGSVVAGGGLPPPSTNVEGVTAPQAGLIVKYRLDPSDGQMHWLDKMNRRWDTRLRMSLPDKDVFAINATTLAETSFYTGVGTVLFNLVVNPVPPYKVYVSNTDANNDTRFEGPGDYRPGTELVTGERTVRGHLVESRITVLDGASVNPQHLNKHIDYSQCCAPNPVENARSLAFPTSMAVSSDGTQLYVAAFGSSKVGFFATAALESGSFTPDPANHAVLTGGGPSGVVLDELRGVLYVLTRFDNGVSVVSTATKMETVHLRMYSPEPPSVVDGRRFLYDAANTSSHGDSACASCHIFGDFDSLAWDLGNPDDNRLNNPGPFVTPPGPVLEPIFHPMKGPMTTQSLRGMDNHGPMHWRGDRTGGNDLPEGETSHQPDTGSFDEVAGFKKFNVAFPGLLGNSAQLSEADMQAFTDFVLQITYPPNPIRNLDNSLTADQDLGRDFYINSIPSDTFEACIGCHILDRDGNRQYGVARPGFFGTDGRSSFENEPQLFKIPHLRNMYQKVGMFGMSPDPFFTHPNPEMGPQVRGFGFLHDGSADTLFRFHSALVFVRSAMINPGGFPAGAVGDPVRRQVEAFLFAFDSNLYPIVGQQVTLTAGNGVVAGPRIDVLEARAAARECDLVAKGLVSGQAAGFLFSPTDGTFARSGSTDPPLSDSDLRSLASQPQGELTFTCVPPGNGDRIAGE